MTLRWVFMEDHSGGSREEGWHREHGSVRDGWCGEYGSVREGWVESVGVGKKAGGIFEIHLAGRTSKILARDSLPVMWSAPCEIVLTEDFTLLWIRGAYHFPSWPSFSPFLTPYVGLNTRSPIQVREA